LPYLARRPLKLARHAAGMTFYHKGRLPPAPSSVHQLRIEKRAEKAHGYGLELAVDRRLAVSTTDAEPRRRNTPAIKHWPLCRPRRRAREADAFAGLWTPRL
jgi:hypothetical protein